MSDAQTPKTDATVINGWLDVNEWRQRAMHYEYQWSNCSPCCAGLQGRAERAESALAAAKASLDKWEAAGRALHSDAETIVIVARETQEELAAAKAEAEELRKELADRPSIGMVQLLKQTIKAEHDEAEAMRDLLRECRRFVVERSWSGCASEEDANVCLANIDAAIDAARKG